jgi:NAD(P)-dependent dehydrogenase (short-subunit alcohol dehydrogenase family)
MIPSNKTPRTWLVTGADKGLGFQTAKAALERGDRVVVTVLADDGSHALSAQYPDRLRAFHLDARDQDRIGTVVANAEQAFGGIDVLMNNAGYGMLSVSEETTPDRYRPLFEVNFFSLAEMTRAILPYMRQRRAGHIINLSSYGVFGGSLGFSFYCAAKLAVEGFSETLAEEVRHLGIHVTIVEPGGFRSDFAGPSLETRLSAIADYAPVGERIATYTAQRHGGQPNDPVKFGQAMCRLVDTKQPPLHLPLGADAIERRRRQLDAIAAEIDEWRDLSLSTQVDHRS